MDMNAMLVRRLPHRRQAAVARGFLLASALLSMGVGGPARAARLVSAGEVAYYSGAGDQITRTALGLLGADFDGSDAFAGAMRFSDSRVGLGTGYLLGGGLGVGEVLQLRAAGTRSIGDGTYRGWHIKAGSRLRFPEGRLLTLSWTRDDNSSAGITNGALAEAEGPLGAGVTLLASAGWTYAWDGTQGVHGGLGIGWTPWAHLGLNAELGAAQNSVGARGSPMSGPGRGPAMSRLGMGGGQGPMLPASESPSQFAPTISVSARFEMP